MDLNDLFLTWYSWLSGPSNALALPLQELSYGLGIPLLSAFLFGLLGTTAPCQLSTNFGALAFLARSPAARGATIRATLAYIAAKVLVYTLLGALVLAVGRQLSSALIPYIELARRLIGPGMIVLGLAVLGVIRSRLQLGGALGERIRLLAVASGAGMAASRSGAGHMPIASTLLPAGAALQTGGSGDPAHDLAPPAAAAAPGVRAGFLLGLAFSCAFCPTLFVLFFGATMTMAVRVGEGFVMPALFALGTAVPLALFVALTVNSAPAARRFLRTLRRANRPLRLLGGVVLIVLGLHDTFIYWLL